MVIYKGLAKSILTVFAIVFLIACFAQASDQVIIINVVDGDSLKVFYDGQIESIRLIGIDTPESRKNKKAYKDSERSGEDIEKIIAMGEKATEYVKNIIKPSDKINIEFDVQKRDQYKRLLGYVYLNDGRMLNEEIIRAGYANLMTIPPNVKYRDRFLKAYQEAREKDRGLFNK